MNNLPKARTETIVIQELEKELLIYDLTSNKALCLNETSKIIWQACDGNTSFDEFRRKTNLKFSDELIWLALNQLKTDNLLGKNVEIEPKFNGLNRRQVIKKIGFATMIALPMISSIVAPRAINAQSGAGGCVDHFECPNDPLNFCFDSLCQAGVCNTTFFDGSPCAGVNDTECRYSFCNNGLCEIDVNARNGSFCDLPGFPSESGRLGVCCSGNCVAGDTC